MAKEALSTATAQAAEKAASSVRSLAQKSFRLSMDIKLKAPLIIIPQSSISHNALVMDLGLIRVENSFSLLPIHGCPLPAVIDNMYIQLTQLKLSRSVPVLKDCTALCSHQKKFTPGVQFKHIFGDRLGFDVFFIFPHLRFSPIFQDMCGPDIRSTHRAAGTSKSTPENQEEPVRFLV